MRKTLAVALPYKDNSVGDERSGRVGTMLNKLTEIAGCADEDDGVRGATQLCRHEVGHTMAEA